MSLKVDFAELAPSPAEFLGRIAYLHLALSRLFSDAAALNSALSHQQALAESTAHSIGVNAVAVGELRRLGIDAEAAEAEYRERTDAFIATVRGQRPLEAMVTAYVVVGFLRDFSLALASGMRSDTGARLEAALSGTAEEDRLRELLFAAIAEDPAQAHLLALWGRRLVGDTLLFAHDVLALDGAGEHVEPVFTELIAVHTRRMDALGLTA